LSEAVAKSILTGSARASPRRGAYGFAFSGLAEQEEVSGSLVEVPPHWPSLELVERTEHCERAVPRLDPDSACLPLLRGGCIEIDRRAHRIVIQSPRPLGTDELVHPQLARVSAVFAHWLGRLSLHAGAFVVEGNAYALLGGHESGKSSTTAWLARRGDAVLSDDLTVLDGTKALAGPRAIDLRTDYARHQGIVETLPGVRKNDRLRLSLGPAPTEAPVAGWVTLAWGDVVELRRLGADERMRAMLEARAVLRFPSDAAGLLRFCSLPAFELRRPRRLESIEDAGQALLAAVAELQAGRR
jgi:hypothetical protein